LRGDGELTFDPDYNICLGSSHIIAPRACRFLGLKAGVNREKENLRVTDVDNIVRSDIVHRKERQFITSPDKERELGAQYFAAFERSAKLIRDPEITTYLSALAQNIERNSDAHMPITIIVVDSNSVNACTSPGGYQYVTRGLIVHTETEGELAAVFAHGVAHTALRFPTRQQVRQALLTVVTARNDPGLHMHLAILAS
jgi:predicted Zn-dependent protease